MDFNSIKDKIKEIMTVDNAKALLVKAKENAPTKEQMDASIKTLQEVINNIYEKSIQGASNVSTIYQQTVNGPQVEQIVAMVYKEKTPEQQQRALEKILYLYMLQFAVNNFDPPIDLPTMTKDEEHRFFKALLSDDGPNKEQINRMIRQLLLLFNNERLGVSAVEYNSEMNSDAEIREMYRSIIDSARSKEIMSSINGMLDDNEYIQFFLEEIIKDVNEGQANDSKYFGKGTDYVTNMKSRIKNFIKGHNVYVTTYMREGKSLAKEIPKIDRIIESINNDHELAEDKETMMKLKAVAERLKLGIEVMVNASSQGDIHVHELHDLDALLNDTNKDVKKGNEITEPGDRGDKRKRDEEEIDEEGEERGSGKARMEDKEELGDIDGGGRKRRKTRKLRKRKGRTYRRKTAKRAGKKSRKQKTKKRNRRGKKKTRKSRR